MDSQIQVSPIALIHEQYLTSLYFFGAPGNIPIIGLPEVSQLETENASAGDELPAPGGCVLVCGANDCDYFIGLPGPEPDKLSMSEEVAKGLIGDVDPLEITAQKAAWEPASASKCQENDKKLRKRQWYPDYGPYAIPPHLYSDEENYTRHRMEYDELPLEELQELDDSQNRYYPDTQLPYSTPATASQSSRQNNRNVKISNHNTGDTDGEKRGKAGAKFTDLASPSRRTVGPKEGTRKYPIDYSPANGSGPAPRQSSHTESWSTDPVITFTRPGTQHSPEEVAAYFDTDKEPTYAHPPEVATTQTKQPQAGIDEDSTPRLRKIEHPDGSVEYSFGITSGELNFYNEGDSSKTPKNSKKKNKISGLRAQYGVNDDISRSGWTRKVKRFVIPENKPSAKTTEDRVTAEDRHTLKEAVTNRRTSDQKDGFMLGRGAAPPRKPAPRQSSPVQQHTLPQETQPQPEESSPEEADADEQKHEYEALRRLGIKQYYRGNDNKDELSRDKWAEKTISEDAERIAAENAQQRREERAREKDPKA